MLDWKTVVEDDPTDDDEDVPCPGYVLTALGFDPDEEPVDNTFCPTGKGGGVDATCGKSVKQRIADKLVTGRAMKDEDYDKRFAQLALALKHATPAALERINDNTSQIVAHKDVAAVRAAYYKETKSRRYDYIMGYYCMSSKELHFDGYGTQEGEETVAHELGHAIDGPKMEYSRDDEWKDAYMDEIDKSDNPLSTYARTRPCEGFAEFARLALTGGHEEAAKSFPKCYKFWKDRGLIK